MAQNPIFENNKKFFEKYDLPSQGKFGQTLLSSK